jgi:hypothetical protein
MTAYTLPMVAPPVFATAPIDASNTSTAAVPRTRARLTHATLFAAVQAHPGDTVTAIADYLTRVYGWNAAERLSHLRRLYDIRRTAAATVIQSRLIVPLARTPESISAYFDTLEQQYARAQSQWTEEEEQ